MTRQDGGDTDLTVSPTTLTFTLRTSAAAQTVTVSAAEDGDWANGEAVFLLEASSDDVGDHEGALEIDRGYDGLTYALSLIHI